MNLNEMDKIEFIRLQAQLGLKCNELADTLGVTKCTINNWRNSPNCRITGPAALAMRLLAKYPEELSCLK
jgi:DNA-binding transcriptional regulator YiaG